MTSEWRCGISIGEEGGIHHRRRREHGERESKPNAETQRTQRFAEERRKKGIHHRGHREHGERKDGKEKDGKGRKRTDKDGKGRKRTERISPQRWRRTAEVTERVASAGQRIGVHSADGKSYFGFGVGTADGVC
jgi:hypothetical protein